jgi:hypothetical protein
LTKPFRIQTDASGEGLGAVLIQIDKEHKERVIEYASRVMLRSEQNYSITDQECLAMRWGVDKFHHYLGLQPFIAITDHAALSSWLVLLRPLA